MPSSPDEYSQDGNDEYSQEEGYEQEELNDEYGDENEENEENGEGVDYIDENDEENQEYDENYPQDNENEENENEDEVIEDENNEYNDENEEDQEYNDENEGEFGNYDEENNGEYVDENNGEYVDENLEEEDNGEYIEENDNISESGVGQQADFGDDFDPTQNQNDDEQYHESKPAQAPQFWPANSNEGEKLPLKSRVLEIEVYYGEGVGTNFVTLEILEPAYRKPFLGGYRHRKSGIEYHHASSQTEYMNAKKQQQLLTGNEIDSEYIPKFHRETQTVKTKTRSQQTLREQGTQMAKPGVVIDTSNDRVYIPSAVHFSSEQLLELRIECTIKIQAFVRGWRARRLARSLKQEKIDNEENERKKLEKLQQQESEQKRIELQRRINPKKKEDFEVLYNELEQWRIQEIDTINQTETDTKKKQEALKELLRKETTLLQTIDRLKQTASKVNATEKINKKLEYLAKPKTIENFDGQKTYVETPFTVRAKELMELYHGLVTPMLNIDERLDVLLHVKWTVKEFDCLLTRDIVELIDREADLLNRGRKGASLDGLRKRLSNLFLQFIETPEFNPQSSKLNHATTKFANTQPLNA